jgi:hypothetical protein
MFRPLLGHQQVSVSVKVLNLYPIWTHIMSCLLNSVVLVRKRTIPTERPQPVGEVSANFS